MSHADICQGRISARVAPQLAARLPGGRLRSSHSVTVTAGTLLSLCSECTHSLQDCACRRFAAPDLGFTLLNTPSVTQRACCRAKLKHEVHAKEAATMQGLSAQLQHAMSLTNSPEAMQARLKAEAGPLLSPARQLSLSSSMLKPGLSCSTPRPMSPLGRMPAGFKRPNLELS